MAYLRVLTTKSEKVRSSECWDAYNKAFKSVSQRSAFSVLVRVLYLRRSGLGSVVALLIS
ncbi:hypothetical protein FR932_10015 [Moritella marina ATCC 15381]|uniref:Uncharacterized protein n=1 Tax=Moritella marina ATCC 15381 TaxID=1202962 RepID=A0A5J6WQ79_MORMI|nr:hypothetical protein FR932_10015 [Moritella marina ATCC 15381]